MGSLTSALVTASTAMDAMQQAMSVIQNNVVNASTPGYVTQTPTLDARSFDPSANAWGGVESGSVASSRNQYAEENVWSQNSQLGSATQQSSSLSALQNIVTISGTSGIPSAMSSLYAAFSAWSSSPNTATAQQQVLSAAQSVAQTFNQAAAGIGELQQQTDQQLQSTVTQINQISGQIASFNAQIRNGDENDAGLQAQLYNTLQTLSGITNIQAQTESDGTMTVLMNGQVPLVVGTTTNQLQIDYPAPQPETYPGASPNAQLTTSSGEDVTADASGEN